MDGKYLYVHVQNKHYNIIQTVKLTWISEKESTTSVIRRAHHTYSKWPVVDVVLKSNLVKLFLDPEEDDALEVLSQYPEDGDVFVRIPKADQESATKEEIYVHCDDKTFRYSDFMPGVTTFGDIAKWFAGEAKIANPTKFVKSLGYSLDGDALIGEAFADKPNEETTAAVSEDGDLHLMPNGVPQKDTAHVDPTSENLSSSSALAGKAAEEPASESAASLMRSAESKAEFKKYVQAIKLLNFITVKSHGTESWVKAQRRVAELHVAGKNYKKAISALEKVQSAAPNNIDVMVDLGHAQFKQGDFSGAEDSFRLAITAMTRNKVTNEKLRTTICIHLGGATFQRGLREKNINLERKGIDTVQKAVNGDVSNSLGVLWMSRFYVRMAKTQKMPNLWVDAITTACRLCAMCWENPQLHPQMEEYKKHLAHVFSEMGELEAVNLLKEIYAKDNAQKLSYEMWVFFAVNCRDHGQMEASLKLYEFAMAIAPNRSNIVLNYAHGLENIGDHNGALRAMKKHLNHLGNVIIGSVQPRHVLKLLESIPDSELTGKFPCPNIAHLKERLDKPRANVRFVDEQVTLYNSHDECANIAPGTSDSSPLVGENSANDIGPLQKVPYTEDQLGLLGIYFTIAKNLFITGHLAVLPELVALLNPLRVGKELHRTVMRNEHAYFLTVTAIMQFLDFHRPSAMPKPNPEQVIYMCGDSHSLSPSWQTVNVGGKETLLVNAIVTGVKIWHLRPGCVFYPRRNFDAVTRHIPKGAEVMFNIGEIDCREGIVSAVEEGRYQNFQEALEQLADIYIDALLQMRKKFSKIYVHLPLPTLEVTCQIVLNFDKILGEKLAKHHDKLQVVYCHVVDEKLKLLDNFRLDSTHISPSYTPLLQMAMNNPEGSQ